MIARLENVRRSFGATQALTGLDLQLRRGELLALLGPNGAGKTTAISILLGRRRADSGVVELMGRPPHEVEARRRIGATPQDAGFPERLRVSEVVDLVGAHYDDPVPTSELLSDFSLASLAHRQTGGLSGGERRRLAVALAFVGRPDAVFLDEPTTGLDVEARRGVWLAVRRYMQEGGTVLLTTHYLEEAEALAERVVVVNGGRVVAEGTVEEIRQNVGLRRVVFRASVLPDLPGVVESEERGGVFTVYTTDSDRLVEALVAGGTGFRDLEVRSTSLEEAFLVLTGEET